MGAFDFTSRVWTTADIPLSTEGFPAEVSLRRGIGSLDLSDPKAVEQFVQERNERIAEMMSALTPERVIERMTHGFSHILNHVHGYEITAKQTQLALLTGNSHLIIGPTGSGKSLYSRAVLGLLGAGVLTYADQFTFEKDEGGVYGLIPLRKVEDGTGCRNLEGSFALADFAFIDEIFDARNELLRSLIWPMSDGQYRNGNAVVPSILHSVIACGNYTRYDEKTAAVLDRFLFQTNVARNRSPVDRVDLLADFATNRHVPLLPFEERLSVAELRYISAVIDGRIPSQRVVIPPELLMLLDAVVTDYDDRRRVALVRGAATGIDDDVSERNLKQLARVVAAHALLHGRRAVTIDDLSSIACAVPVVGVEVSTGLFKESWEGVMRQGASPGERNVLENLWRLRAMLNEVGEGVVLRPMTLPEKVMEYFGWVTNTTISYNALKQAIRKLDPGLPYARHYQADLLSKVDSAMGKRGQREDDPIRRITVG